MGEKQDRTTSTVSETSDRTKKLIDGRITAIDTMIFLIVLTLKNL